MKLYKKIGASNIKDQRKHLSTIPSDDHGIIIDWIKHTMPDLQPIVIKIDELINKNIPKLQYAIKWGKAFYGTPELGWITEIAAYDVSLNMVFHAGTEFNPVPPLGTDDRSRYVKIRSIDDAISSDVFNWIKQARNYIG